MTYDLVVRGGRVVPAHETFEAEVAVSGETIAALGTGLRGRRLHYLVLTEAADDRVTGRACEISPPLRSEEHRLALWHGIAGGAIGIASTDHRPRRRIRTPTAPPPRLPERP